VFLAFGVDDVVAKAPRRDERGIARDVAGALQEVTGREVPDEEHRPDDIEIRVGEHRARREVVAQHGERVVRGTQSFADYITT